MKKLLGVSIVLAAASVAQAADIEAGKELAASVCAGMPWRKRYQRERYDSKSRDAEAGIH